MTSVGIRRRWTTKDRDTLVDLIKKKKVDHNIATKQYINRIQNEYSDKFGFCTPEIFARHYRKVASNYSLAQQLDSRSSMFI